METGARSVADTPDADTWYHLFVIKNNTSGVVDGGYDTSLAAVNLLADATGYTEYRRIWSVLTDVSSNIIPYDQWGDLCLWLAPPLDVTVSNLGTTALLYPLSTPLGIRTLAKLRVIVGKSSAAEVVDIRNPDATDASPSLSAAPLAVAGEGSSISSIGSPANVEILTDISSQIEARSNLASTTLRVAVTGWWDTRGRND